MRESDPESGKWERFQGCLVEMDSGVIEVKGIHSRGLSPVSHLAYDQVTTYLRLKNVGIVGKS